MGQPDVGPSSEAPGPLHVDELIFFERRGGMVRRNRPFFKGNIRDIALGHNISTHFINAVV